MDPIKNPYSLGAGARPPEDKPLGLLLASHLRTLLFDLDRMADAGDKVKDACEC